LSEEHSLSGGGLRDPWDDAVLSPEDTDGLTDVILGDEPVAGGLPGACQQPEVPEPQPINQATMECLRGPCVHYWAIISRYETTVDGVRAKCTRTCIASGYADTPLNDANIYACDKWWPQTATLGKTSGEGASLKGKITPVDGDGFDFGRADELIHSILEKSRGRYRRPLRKAWENALEAMGYDFSWRDFDPDTFFTDDDEDQRKHSAIGGYADSRKAKDEAKLPPAAGVPEDDDEATEE